MRCLRSILSAFLKGAKGKYAPGDLPPGVAKLVTGHASPYVTMVMTDVEGSTRLWEWDSHAMAKAITMHETLMRKLMRRYSGYEVRSCTCSHPQLLLCKVVALLI